MVIVITGGSAGVGRATARRFARDGAAIAVLARGQDGLDATVAEIEALGGRGLAIPTDVADPEQVLFAAKLTEDTLGPIDIWINNAMTTVFGPVSSITPAELRRVVDVTFHGTVWGTQVALAAMRGGDADGNPDAPGSRNAAGCADGPEPVHAPSRSVPSRPPIHRPRMTNPSSA